MNSARPGARLAVFAVLVYVAALAIRPLNANDLFWHLASGHQILAEHAVPRADPFSFASDRGPWIDHEWLWQAAADGIYESGSSGRGPMPDETGNRVLILGGAAVALAAFGVALRRLAVCDLPGGFIVPFGLLGAEIAKERLMVRPETASLLFLAILLALLEAGPGVRGRLPWICLLTCLWANVHPAALLAPVLVLLYGVVDWRTARTGATGSGAAILAAGLTAAATIVNPYGWRLWSVPFTLSSLVKAGAFYNPEWLSPPLRAFPLFYAGLALVAFAALAQGFRHRRLPDASILSALMIGALASRQMRHLGLFAIALVFAGPSLVAALRLAGSTWELLRRSVVVTAASLAAAGAACAAVISGWSLPAPWSLDPRRFPVEACERIEARVPGIRLYNDVQFGGYLIWRRFPGQKVFIDGRNELYAGLLPRLAAIHTGASPYEDWRKLIADYGIEGAIVRYKDTKKGVLYAGAKPGDPQVPGYRAWSAFLFPRPEWALVYFDDTAMVFLKRGGSGEAWVEADEYRDLNPEDADYLLERARTDPALLDRLRQELARRERQTPECERARRLAQDLERVTLPVTSRPSSVRIR